MIIEQPLALYRKKLLEVNKLSPAEITQLKEEAVFCPVCKKEGSLTISKKGPLFSHTAEHEPETKSRALAKQILAQQLQYIFSRGTVERNLVLTGQVADIALLHPSGAKIAIRYISGNETTDTLPLWRDALLQEKIHLLLLLDGARLAKTVREREKTEARKITLGKTESTLLALGEDLLYFHPEKRLLHLPQVSPRLKVLARKTGGKRIGQVPAIIYRHKLSSLRVIRGQWYLDNTYNDPSPIHGFEENLPDNIELKMQQFAI